MTRRAATAEVKEIRTQLLVGLLAHVKSNDPEVYQTLRDLRPLERQYQVQEGLQSPADLEDIAEAFRRVESP